MRAVESGSSTSSGLTAVPLAKALPERRKVIPDLPLAILRFSRGAGMEAAL